MTKILIVEDNEDNREALSRRLLRRRYEVVTAENGGTGAALAKVEQPDVILMDMNMPEVDGWEATHLVKSDPATAHIPIIALTAHAMTGDRGRALAAGCADYHTKPVEFAKLLSQIESICHGRAGRGRASSPDAIARNKPE